MKMWIALFLLLSSSCFGQGLPANTSAMGCLNSSAAVASNAYGVMRCDAKGNLLVGDVTFAPGTAYAIQRTASIGTTGVLVSASDPVARRAVANTGSSACEIVAGLGSAYGTGYPLPANSFFSFDGVGRTTAAIYVACSGLGGSAAVISY